MAAKSTNIKAHKKESRFSENELGLLQPFGEAVGGIAGNASNGRFEPIPNASHRSRRNVLKDAALRVHDGLNLARAIAVSIYGHKWEPHVIEVFDRLQLLSDEEQDRHRHTHTQTDDRTDGPH